MGINRKALAGIPATMASVPALLRRYPDWRLRDEMVSADEVLLTARSEVRFSARQRATNLHEAKVLVEMVRAELQLRS